MQCTRVLVYKTVQNAVEKRNPIIDELYPLHNHEEAEKRCFKRHPNLKRGCTMIIEDYNIKGWYYEKNRDK